MLSQTHFTEPPGKPLAQNTDLYFVDVTLPTTLCVFHSLRPHGLHAPCQNPLSSTISWSLLKFMSIELVILSNHLILCHSFFFLPSIFPGIRIFSSESVLHIRWSKYWSFNFSQQSFQWIIRVDFLKDGLVWAPCSPKDSQESYPAPQFESINSSALSLLFDPTLISIWLLEKS